MRRPSVSTASDTAEGTDSYIDAPAGLYRHYVLFLCCSAGFLAYADRTVFGALLLPIKAEFGLSDTMLGLLSGLAFAITYCVFGLPLGSLSDCLSRKTILVSCVTVWSLMTAACGAATSAFWLALTRLGVGAGEAGVTPASISTISDLYPVHQRTRAIALFPIATSLGGAAAFPIGANMAAAYGWRSVFIVLAVPGLLLAVLMLFTFRDPRGTSPTRSATHDVPGFWLTFRTIVTKPQLMLAFSAAGFSSMLAAMILWLPAFYERSHGLGRVETGNMIGLILLISGPIGMITGGWLGDRAGSAGPRKVAYLLALFALMQVVSAALMLLVADSTLSFVFACIWSAFLVAFVPPCYALSQNLVQPRMRGTSMGVLNIFNNLIGYGLGPVVIGGLSEALAQSSGTEALRFALVTIAVVLGGLAAIFFVLSGRATGVEMAQAS